MFGLKRLQDDSSVTTAQLIDPQVESKLCVETLLRRNSTYHNLWDVIVNGNLEEEPAPTTGETFASPAPKTAKQLAARRNQERVKSILLLAIPDEYLLKFHNVADAKSLWEAIKSRFGGNVESKKMQKNSIEVSYAHFKGRPQPEVSLEAFHLHESYALIMRNKPDIDEIDIDDLYNNLRVYEDELKRSSGSNSASQNLAFLSSENTSSTNEVSTASGDLWVVLLWLLIKSINSNDLEELDLRWQIAMLTVRVKKFIQRTGRNMEFKEKRHVSLDKSKIECYNCHRKGHFAKECRSGRIQRRRSMVTMGSEQLEPVNYALMAISSSSSSSSSDSEVQKCSKCLESFKCLQKNYDTEREKHNKAKLEIRGYEIALESLESKIIGHEKNELAWGEKYEFQNYELKCREIKINNLNLELEKVVKERDELKDKIAKWEESTKNLEEILKSQMSARDKTGLDQVMMSIYQKMKGFIKNGYKLSPPINRNFLTPRADISFAGLDEYAIRNKIIESQTTELNNKTDETVGKTNDANTKKPKSVTESVVSNPKINRDSVIIEDWTSDDKEEVSGVQKVRPETRDDKTNYANTEKPKSVTESVVSNPKINRDSVIIEDWTSDDKEEVSGVQKVRPETRDDKSGQNSHKQGVRFRKVKACFVCKSTDHLIKDCNFHDKKSQESNLKNVVNTSKRESKPV
ncbi:ribonuclease H-like domain-containing protein [Tanacetum coccineum]